MKRLYKNKSKAKVSGVCQGLAEYFDMDSSIIRILWAVLTLFSNGIFLLVYIICAVVLPDKQDIEFNDYTVKEEENNKESD